MRTAISQSGRRSGRNGNIKGDISLAAQTDTGPGLGVSRAPTIEAALVGGVRDGAAS
ncbi:protein of unknown function [Hyphomicrobium sp. MC1]|nr:protein of unknown function [Hyphomicrobium sp. MC1]